MHLNVWTLPFFSVFQGSFVILLMSCSAFLQHVYSAYTQHASRVSCVMSIACIYCKKENAIFIYETNPRQ